MEPGLYHIGFKIGDSPADAKKAYRELKEKGVTIVGTGDHTVTHSIYILDPDGNELELYADVSDKWKKDPRVILMPTKELNLWYASVSFPDEASTTSPTSITWSPNVIALINLHSAFMAAPSAIRTLIFFAW